MTSRTPISSRSLLLAALLAALSVVLLSACGGGTTTVTVTEGAEASESSDLEQIDAAAATEEEEAEAEEEGFEEGSCEEEEISAGTRKEGTCFDGDTKWVVVNKGTPLRMETLVAKLRSVEQRKSISGEYESATANGVFVTFTLAITNLTHKPQEFDERQAVLLVDENIFTQDFDVQNGVEQRSFLWESGPIQPQEEFEGTVTFDVPTKVAKRIDAVGNLDVLNFGVEYYDAEEVFEQEEIGSIRTYK